MRALILLAVVSCVSGMQVPGAEMDESVYQSVAEACRTGAMADEPYPVNCACFRLCVADIEDEDAEWTPADCVGMCD